MQFSVVVTIVEGGSSLRRCLASLARQDGGPELQVLVPYDSTVLEISAQKAEFPEFEFLDLGHVSTEYPPESPAGAHELFDRRRAAGLDRATGTIVAILEDRGVPRPDWASRHVQLHAERPGAVIGGAVENGVDRLRNWAVYFCDFARYQPPLDAGSVKWVTDVNVSYPREHLEATRPLWQGRYHETTVHWELQRRGVTLWLSPEPIVDQVRTQVAWRQLLLERYHWGRLFGYTRARECGLARRWLLAAGSLVLPWVLLLRHTRTQLRKGRRWKFLQAAPLVFVLLAFWSLGEMRAYVTGRS